MSARTDVPIPGALPGHVRESSWQAKYLRRFYYDVPGWIDGTREFYGLCKEYIKPSATVLEVGAGPSNDTSAYLASLCTKLIGLDIDPDVHCNRFLTEAHVYDGSHFPLRDESVNIVVANYVNEHVINPKVYLQEIARVLQCGGAFIFRTPNFFHYIPIAASLCPRRLQLLIANRLRNLPTDAHDPYPVVYRLNSESRLHVLLPSAGLYLDRCEMVEKEPSYGLYSRLLFFAMLCYERIVNATPRLRKLRANIFGVAVKPQEKGSNYHTVLL